MTKTQVEMTTSVHRRWSRAEKERIAGAALHAKSASIRTSCSAGGNSSANERRFPLPSTRWQLRLSQRRQSPQPPQLGMRCLSRRVNQGSTQLHHDSIPRDRRAIDHVIPNRQIGLRQGFVCQLTSGGGGSAMDEQVADVLGLSAVQSRFALNSRTRPTSRDHN
jgi:hypothetical protein